MIDMKNAETLTAIKPKSVIINGDLHGRFKLQCKGRCLKIGGVIEDLIKLYLNDPRGIQKVIDEHKDSNYF